MSYGGLSERSHLRHAVRRLTEAIHAMESAHKANPDRLVTESLLAKTKATKAGCKFIIDSIDGKE